jgi:hypothetical protein
VLTGATTVEHADTKSFHASGEPRREGGAGESL